MQIAIIDRSTNKIKAKHRGNVKLPSNFTDPAKVITISVPDEMDLEMVNYGLLPEVPEFWSKEGEDNVATQPTLAAALWTKAGETPVTIDPEDASWMAHAINDPDPAWMYTPVLAAHNGIFEDQSLIAARLAGVRDGKLARLRHLRKMDKFPEFELLVTNFVLGDTTHTQQELSDLQASLKDMTNSYRKGPTGQDFKEGTAALDSIDPENFTWPTI